MAKRTAGIVAFREIDFYPIVDMLNKAFLGMDFEARVVLPFNKVNVDILIIPPFEGYMPTWGGLPKEEYLSPSHDIQVNNDVIVFFNQFFQDYWFEKTFRKPGQKADPLAIITIGNASLYLWQKLGGKLFVENKKVKIHTPGPKGVTFEEGFFHKDNLLGFTGDFFIDTWVEEWMMPQAKTDDGTESANVTVTV